MVAGGVIRPTMVRVSDDARTTTRAELRMQGMTSREITDAVARGELIRARRNVYLSPTAPAAVVRAARVGGRLTCLSLLALLGVFVRSNRALHVHIEPGSGRLRHPEHRHKRLRRPRKRCAGCTCTGERSWRR